MLRYEDVIQTNDEVLDKALGWISIQRPALLPQKREFSQATLLVLEQARSKLLLLNCGNLYSRNDIKAALKQYGL